MDVSEKKYGLISGPALWLTAGFLLTYLLIEWFGGLKLEELALCSTASSLIHCPWTIFTYAFTHGGDAHLLANVVGLCVAAILLNGICSRFSFIAIFFTGSMTGALLYITSAWLFPAQLRLLVGASAGVMALLATALLLRRKYFYFAGTVIASCLYGSVTAHLGGCVAGCIWTILMTGTVESPFADIRLVRAAGNRTEALLCKISSSGYDALSQREKTELDLLTRKKRHV